MSKWQDQVNQLMDQALSLHAAGQYEASVKMLSDAFREIPEPKKDHGVTMLLLMRISDSHIELGHLDLAEEALIDAHYCPKLVNVAYLQIRKGKLYLLTDREKDARKQFISAYLNGGQEVFENETEAYAMIADAVRGL